MNSVMFLFFFLKNDYGCNDKMRLWKASTVHRESALLFAQTILLVGQAFNSLAYQRRLNIRTC